MSSARGNARDEGGEQPIELRRHLDALRRGRRLIIVLVLLMTGAAVGVSLILPPSYKATARIVFNPTADPLAQQDAASIQRQLATVGSLITTPTVLARVADSLGRSLRSVQKAVGSSVDPQANIVNVNASDRTALGAQQIANATARTFVSQQRSANLRQLEEARARLQDQLRAIQGQPNNAVLAAAIRTRLSELGVSEASAGAELQLAEAAQRPTSPSSPRPVRNGILAFFTSIFVGVLVALGRDQLVPRVSGPRELSRITDRPILGSVPYVRRRFGRQPRVLSAVEHEAYQTLQAAVRFQLSPDHQHVILVTSALEGEGKTTVTANLSRALARAGRKTLAVSTDMRHPRLHETFGLDAAPGLSEVLTALDREGEASVARTIAALKGLLSAQSGLKGNLHVLPSGKKPGDPGRLLLGAGLATLFDQLREMDYEYVILDGTPLLGIADAQLLARRADELLLVSRLDRATLEDVVEARDVLERMEVSLLGHVVIGTRRSASSYYYAAKSTEFESV